jgi:integrase/recombinase XerD
MINAISPDGAYSFESIQFNIRKMILNRTNKDGKTKVYIEVQQQIYKGIHNYDQKIKRQSTGIWIDPKNWNQKKQLVMFPEHDAEYKNNMIEQVYLDIKKFINSRGAQEPDQAYTMKMDIDSIREFFPARKQQRKTLVDLIDDYIELRRRQQTIHGTLKEFISLKNRLTAFDEWRGKKTYIEDITFLWSNDFEIFLRNEAEHNRNPKGKKGYNEGTVEKTYTVLVTVLNYYYKVRKEMNLEVDAVFRERGFKRGKKSVNEANPLGEEQLYTLYYHTFNKPSLERTKIRFCFQCFTSLRFNDMDKIRPQHIINDVLHYKPHKTERYDVKMEQPLNQFALEILESCNYDTTEMKISYQPYMRQIREMFDEVREKYPKLKYGHYSTHSGRDTYITLCVLKGASWKNILTWVGQSSYRIMDRYIKLTPESQRVEVSNVFKAPEEAKN